MARSKPPLHNFSLPPSLKWANQKFLRCMKLSPDDDETHIPQSQSQSQPQSQSSPTRDRNRDRRRAHCQSSIQLTYSRSSHAAGKSPISRKIGDLDPETGNGVEVREAREKLALDLQAAEKNLKMAILDHGLEPARPWNLRTRRAACTAPEEQLLGSPPARADTPAAGISSGGDDRRKKRAQVSVSVSLSREEIEEDFLAMVGKRPPRRPKKRARIVQRQLETLFPGSRLTEVTPESYKVHDVPEQC